VRGSTPRSLPVGGVLTALGECELPLGWPTQLNSLALTSIRSSFVNGSPEMGSVPFSSVISASRPQVMRSWPMPQRQYPPIYRSISDRSYTVPKVRETTGTVGGAPETRRRQKCHVVRPFELHAATHWHRRTWRFWGSVLVRYRQSWMPSAADWTRVG
jgi:hypothetical protein